MKKIIITLLAALFLVGCTSKVSESTTAPSTASESQAQDKKPVVVVTTSFLEDIVNVLAKDLVEVEVIIPANEDPHTYEAKPEDFNKLDRADLILYHGLHFEGKILEFLEAKNGVDLTANFDKANLLVMEEDGHEIVDPHFWFDIELYKQATTNAYEALKTVLPTQDEVLKTNLDAYATKLDELKEYGIQQIGSIEKSQRILITPHDAFGYFARQYDIQVAAPQGVSTDAELSIEDLTKTADFIVENQVKAIFAETTTDPARMEKLKESCKAKGFEVKVVSGEHQELYSDSLAPKGVFGDNYIDMVKHNIDLMVTNLK
ncbi:MAG: zinc ABC transporter substrate-binding protein [Erysipelotrichaceae bacterium]|nr:zinc ABC transporter substrate-binding protein [Erysipelotrichaceae bacterium]